MIEYVLKSGYALYNAYITTFFISRRPVSIDRSNAIKPKVMNASLSPCSLRRIPMTHASFILIITAIYVWAAYHSSGMYPDTPRDFYFAQRIALGDEFPLNGPAANNTFHSGPLWFYILALPLWLTGLPGIIPITVGLFGATKFLLYYRLGWLFGGAQAAIIFVLASLYPGWSSYTLVPLTHTIVIEATTILGIFAAIHARRQQTYLSYAALGLAVALMLHAHPTAFFPALFLGIFTLWALPTWKRRFSFILISIAVTTLLFLPVIIGQAIHGFPDLENLASYSNKEPLTLSLKRFFGLWAAVFLYGTHYIARFWFELPTLVCLLLVLAQSCALFVIGRSLYLYGKTSYKNKKIIALLLVFMILHTFVIMLLRSITPLWFSFSYLPAITILCGIGLYELGKQGARGRYAAVSIMVFWFCWSMAGNFYIGKSLYEPFVDTPPPKKRSLMNISNLGFINNGKHITVARFPIADLYTMAEPLCDPVHVYGHYALFIDTTFGAGVEKHCTSSKQVSLGGYVDIRQNEKGMIGLRDYAWTTLQLEPQKWLGTLGVIAPEKVWSASKPLFISNPNMYPPHRDTPLDIRDFSVEIKIPTDRAILVSKRLGTLRISSAFLNGSSVVPSYQDISGTFVFALPFSNTSTTDKYSNWTFNIQGDPDYIDIVSFRAQTTL